MMPSLSCLFFSFFEALERETHHVRPLYHFLWPWSPAFTSAGDSVEAIYLLLSSYSLPQTLSFSKKEASDNEFVTSSELIKWCSYYKPEAGSHLGSKLCQAPNGSKLIWRQHLAGLEFGSGKQTGRTSGRQQGWQWLGVGEGARQGI